MNEVGPNEQPDGSVPIVEGPADDFDDEFSRPKEVKPKKKKTSSAGTSVTRKKGKDVIVDIPPGKTVFFDLDYNIAAALCYFPLLPVVAPVVWLKTEPNGCNDYLKWHAVQGIVFFIGFLGLSVLIGTGEAILSAIPAVGGIIALPLTLLRALLAVLFFLTSFKQMFAVYNSKQGKLPFVGNLTDQYLQNQKL